MNCFGAAKLGRFAGLFRANELGRFAVIDKVQVINPHDKDKGGREIDRLMSYPQREALWIEAKTKYGLIEIVPRLYANCKIASHSNAKALFTRYDLNRQFAVALTQKFKTLLGWRSSQTTRST
jgi:hypothetical protein